MTIIPLHQKQQSDSFVLLQYKIIMVYLNNLIMTITEIVWLLVKKILWISNYQKKRNVTIAWIIYKRENFITSTTMKK